MSPRRALLPLLAAAVLAPAGLAACGDEGTPVGAVPARDELAKDTSTRLLQAGGGPAPPVARPTRPRAGDGAARRRTAAAGRPRSGAPQPAPTTRSHRWKRPSRRA